MEYYAFNVILVLALFSSSDQTYPVVHMEIMEYTDWVLREFTDYVWLREPNCTAIQLHPFSIINLDFNRFDRYARLMCTKPEECPLGFVQIEDLCYPLNSSLSYVCYPNGTIVVDNPNTSIFQTSFANGTSNKEDILLAFTNRTVDYDFIIGGRQVDTYILHCNLVGGVTRSFVQGFSPTLSAVQVNSITPYINLISALRTGQNFSSPVVNSAVLASPLYWTIDVDVQYYSNPRTCTVYSGDTVSPSVLSTERITNGCTHDADLVGNFGELLFSSRWTRNVALFHVFKFYNSDYITIQCTVEYCLNAIDCVPDCSRRRRRYAPLARHHNNTDGFGQRFNAGIWS